MIKLLLLFLVSLSAFAQKGARCMPQMEELMKDESWMEMIRDGQKSQGCEYELTDLERTAIFNYTDDGWDDFNGPLWAGDDTVKPCADALNSALAKLPVYESEKLLYRTTELSAKDYADHAEGSVVTYKGFTSTSRKPRSMKQDTHLLLIKSKNGKDISSCSSYKEEAEILFPAGTQFKVLQRNGNVIHLEEVVP